MPLLTPHVPNGLIDLMKDLAKEVLREKPENIYEFAVIHFEKLILERDGSLDKGYEEFSAFEAHFDGQQRFAVPSNYGYICQRPIKIHAIPQTRKSKSDIMASFQAMESINEEDVLASVPNLAPAAAAEEAIPYATDEKYQKAIYVIQRYFRRYMARKKNSSNTNTNSTTITTSTETKSLSAFAAAIIIQRTMQRLFSNKIKLKKDKAKERERDSGPCEANAVAVASPVAVKLVLDDMDNVSEAASYTSSSTIQMLADGQEGRENRLASGQSRHQQREEGSDGYGDVDVDGDGDGDGVVGGAADFSSMEFKELTQDEEPPSSSSPVTVTATAVMVADDDEEHSSSVVSAVAAVAVTEMDRKSIADENGNPTSIPDEDKPIPPPSASTADDTSTAHNIGILSTKIGSNYNHQNLNNTNNRTVIDRNTIDRAPVQIIKTSQLNIVPAGLSVPLNNYAQSLHGANPDVLPATAPNPHLKETQETFQVVHRLGEYANENGKNNDASSYYQGDSRIRKFDSDAGESLKIYDVYYQDSNDQEFSDSLNESTMEKDSLEPEELDADSLESNENVVHHMSDILKRDARQDDGSLYGDKNDDEAEVGADEETMKSNDKQKFVEIERVPTYLYGIHPARTPVVERRNRNRHSEEGQKVPDDKKNLGAATTAVGSEVDGRSPEEKSEEESLESKESTSEESSATQIENKASRLNVQSDKDEDEIPINCPETTQKLLNDEHSSSSIVHQGQNEKSHVASEKRNTLSSKGTIGENLKLNDHNEASLSGSKKEDENTNDFSAEGVKDNSALEEEVIDLKAEPKPTQTNSDLDESLKSNDLIKSSLKHNSVLSSIKTVSQNFIDSERGVLTEKIEDKTSQLEAIPIHQENHSLKSTLADKDYRIEKEQTVDQNDSERGVLTEKIEDETSQLEAIPIHQENHSLKSTLADKDQRTEKEQIVDQNEIVSSKPNQNDSDVKKSEDKSQKLLSKNKDDHTLPMPETFVDEVKINNQSEQEPSTNSIQTSADNNEATKSVNNSADTAKPISQDGVSSVLVEEINAQHPNKIQKESTSNLRKDINEDIANAPLHPTPDQSLNSETSEVRKKEFSDHDQEIESQLQELQNLNDLHQDSNVGSVSSESHSRNKRSTKEENAEIFQHDNINQFEDRSNSSIKSEDCKESKEEEDTELDKQSKNEKASESGFMHSKETLVNSECVVNEDSDSKDTGNTKKGVKTEKEAILANELKEGPTLADQEHFSKSMRQEDIFSNDKSKDNKDEPLNKEMVGSHEEKEEKLSLIGSDTLKDTTTNDPISENSTELKVIPDTSNENAKLFTSEDDADITSSVKSIEEKEQNLTLDHKDPKPLIEPQAQLVGLISDEKSQSLTSNDKNQNPRLEQENMTTTKEKSLMQNKIDTDDKLESEKTKSNKEKLEKQFDNDINEQFISAEVVEQNITQENNGSNIISEDKKQTMELLDSTDLQSSQNSFESVIQNENLNSQIANTNSTENLTTQETSIKFSETKKEAVKNLSSETESLMLDESSKSCDSIRKNVPKDITSKNIEDELISSKNDTIPPGGTELHNLKEATLDDNLSNTNSSQQFDAVNNSTMEKSDVDLKNLENKKLNEELNSGNEQEIERNDQVLFLEIGENQVKDQNTTTDVELKGLENKKLEELRSSKKETLAENMHEQETKTDIEVKNSKNEQDKQGAASDKKQVSEFHQTDDQGLSIKTKTDTELEKKLTVEENQSTEAGLSLENQTELELKNIKHVEETISEQNHTEKDRSNFGDLSSEINEKIQNSEKETKSQDPNCSVKKIDNVSEGPVPSNDKKSKDEDPLPVTSQNVVGCDGSSADTSADFSSIGKDLEFFEDTIKYLKNATENLGGMEDVFNAKKNSVKDVSKNADTLNNSAILIQSAFRGYQLRKQLKDMANKDKSKSKAEKSRSKRSLDKRESDDEMKSNAAVKIQSAYRGHRVRREKSNEATSEDPENIRSVQKEDKTCIQSPSKNVLASNSVKSQIPVAVIHPTKYSNSTEESHSEKVSELRTRSPVKQLKSNQKASVKTNQNNVNKSTEGNGQSFRSDSLDQTVKMDQTQILGNRKLAKDKISSSGYGSKTNKLKTKTPSTADIIERPKGSKNVRDQFQRKGKSVSVNGKTQGQESFDLEAIKKELLSTKFKSPPQSGRKKKNSRVKSGKKKSPIKQTTKIPQKSPTKVVNSKQTNQVEFTDGEDKESEEHTNIKNNSNEMDLSKTFTVEMDKDQNLENLNNGTENNNAKKKTLSKTYTVRSSLNEVERLNSPLKIVEEKAEETSENLFDSLRKEVDKLKNTVHEKSAVTIQKTFRGFITRKNLNKGLKSNSILRTTTEAQELPSKGTLINDETSSPDHAKPPPMENISTEIENGKRDIFTEETEKEQLHDPVLNEAATKIQKTYRGYKTRKEIKLNTNKDSVESVKNDHKNIGNKHNLQQNEEIRSEELTNPKLEHSAITIQKTFRGYQSRKQLQSKRISKVVEKKAEDKIKEDTNSNTQIDSSNNDEKGKKDSAIFESLQDSIKQYKNLVLDKSAITIQKHFRGYKVRKDMKKNDVGSEIENNAHVNNEEQNKTKQMIVNKKDGEKPSQDEVSTEELAEDKLKETTQTPLLNKSATIIQKNFRGYKTRQNLKRNKEVTYIESQNNKKQKQGAFDSFDVDAFHDEALQKSATTIQKTFRGYKTRKELLNKKMSSNPGDCAPKNNAVDRNICNEIKNQQLTEEHTEERKSADNKETEFEQIHQKPSETDNQGMAENKSEDNTSKSEDHLDSKTNIDTVGCFQSTEEKIQRMHSEPNYPKEESKSTSAGAVLENAASIIQKAYRDYNEKRNNNFSRKSYSNGTHRETTPKEVLENSDESSTFIGPDTSFDLSDVDSVETRSEKALNYDKINSSEAPTPTNDSEDCLTSTIIVNVHSEDKIVDNECVNTPKKLRLKRSLIEPTAPPLDEILKDEEQVVSPKLKWFVGDEPIVPSGSNSSKSSSPASASSVDPLLVSTSSKCNDLSSIDACRENLNSNQQLTSSINSTVVSTSSLLLTNNSEVHDKNILNKNSGIVSANKEENLKKDEQNHNEETSKNIENEDEITSDVLGTNVKLSDQSDFQEKENNSEKKSEEKQEHHKEVTTDLCKNCAEGIHEGGICSENLVKIPKHILESDDTSDQMKQFVLMEELNKTSTADEDNESSIGLQHVTITGTEQLNSSNNCPAISFIPPSSEDDTSERETSLEVKAKHEDKEVKNKTFDNCQSDDINEKEDAERTLENPKENGETGAEKEKEKETEVAKDKQNNNNIHDHEDSLTTSANLDLLTETNEDENTSTEDKICTQISKENIFEDNLSKKSVDSSSEIGEKDIPPPSFEEPVKEDAFKTRPGDEFKTKEHGFEDDFSDSKEASDEDQTSTDLEHKIILIEESQNLETTGTNLQLEKRKQSFEKNNIVLDEKSNEVQNRETKLTKEEASSEVITQIEKLSDHKIDEDHVLKETLVSKTENQKSADKKLSSQASEQKENEENILRNEIVAKSVTNSLNDNPPSLEDKSPKITENEVVKSEASKEETIVEPGTKIVTKNDTTASVRTKDDEEHEQSQEDIEIAAKLIESSLSDPQAKLLENKNKEKFSDKEVSKEEPDPQIEAKLEKLIDDNLKPADDIKNTVDQRDLPTANSSQEVVEEPCVKKVVPPTPYSASSDPEESELESTTTKAESTPTTPGYDETSETDGLDIPPSKPDELDALAEKLSEPEKMVARMRQRRASEQKLSIDSITDQQAVFEEPICEPIKPMEKIQKSSSTEAEDELVLHKLQRGDTTRESSAQSESVVFGDSNCHLTESEDTFNENMELHSLHRMNTIAANRSSFKPPKHLIKSVTIDDTVKYIDPEKSTEESGSSFCMDDALSEDVRKKMMAYSVSEADSDYYDVGDQTVHSHDDFNISTALDNFPSTDTDTTIVSAAATKIQAGARGFLTRRRIRRASMGTKASLTEDRNVSFGNEAITESLDQLAEEDVGKRQFNRQIGVNSLPSALEHSDEMLSPHGEDNQSAKHSLIKIEPNKTTASLGNDVNELLEKPEHESSQIVSNLEATVARRLTLQRGDALRNDSTPDDENGGGGGISKQVESAKNSPTSMGSTMLVHEKTMVESTTTTTTRTTTERRNYSDAAVSNKKDKIKWFALRQNSMPVQIDSEVFRVLPKHMRKRIKSAEGEKPKRIRLPRD